MYHSQHRFDDEKNSEPFGPQFWDKVVKTLFITGVSLILVIIALKWTGIII
ncbi:hypothetical protein [Aureibaculum marinum]|uniref:hypothetical protein n=1 Tax=Aureibaculum marinum TaxID=2487930 RepID=UPI0013967071|nr:hypothetical protein [Aureibaculum marinum]